MVENGENNKKHYSEKGGHRARHDFWEAVNKMGGLCVNNVPKRELVWLIRRNMPRHPQTGKR